MKAGERRALADWLKQSSGARQLVVTAAGLLTGGAIQENWLISVRADGGPLDGENDLVLRTESASAVMQSHGKAREFTLLEVAHAAGLTVPEPLFVDAGGVVLGKPAFVMRHVDGTTDPGRLTTDRALDPRRPGLTRDLGRQIAKLHTVTPPEARLSFLGPPPTNPALSRLDSLRRQLDRLPRPLPVLEWAVRWLIRNAPASDRVVLCHGDYRIGNIMIDAGRVSGVLDWEFASWSDPLEDIGWFCARCWRFGADQREAGGFGDRADFYEGYAAEAGYAPDWSILPYWEVVATVRWAIIAHHQGLRHLSGAESSMDLALTARKAAEMELDTLRQIHRIEEDA